MPKCCKTNWFPDRADIQQDSSTDDNPSEEFTGTEFKKNVPGRVIDTGGDETYRGRQIEASITHVYECRYFSGVLPTMRLVMVGGIYKDRVFDIKFVKVIREQGKIPQQWLYCSELAET